MRIEVEIINRLGLHARAAAKFVKCASQFICEIHVGKDAMTVNGKSIMGVMMLAASKGVVIEVPAKGRDEDQAIAEIAQLVQNRFGEPE